MANHGPSYGLSRELEKKNIARFNLGEAQEVLGWIEQVTGIQFEKDPATIETSHDMSEMLKDGVQLCMMMNNITKNPKTVRFHVNALPQGVVGTVLFGVTMENISNFLDAIKTYGVAEISCFQTVDLYENKQGYKVIECLRSLAAVAQSKKADVPFPSWAVKIASSKPRQFSESVIRQGEMVIPLQYGTNKCASQKGMTPYGLSRQIKPDGLAHNSQY
ncbi:hypothetical protein L596_000195 [Steinernema carpocapsae]|uniref:Transgelin n=1 Tax=Steinernema carpocapsae TaxID=34508 RepID=A0A4U8UHC8_STECR|nr:hypothetical protein L596_000195 [Steinernema carpocapsae]